MSLQTALKVQSACRDFLNMEAEMLKGYQTKKREVSGTYNYSMTQLRKKRFDIGRAEFVRREMELENSRKRQSEIVRDSIDKDRTELLYQVAKKHDIKQSTLYTIINGQ